MKSHQKKSSKNNYSEKASDTRLNQWPFTWHSIKTLILVIIQHLEQLHLVISLKKREKKNFHDISSSSQQWLMTPVKLQEWPLFPLKREWMWEHREEWACLSWAKHVPLMMQLCLLLIYHPKNGFGDDDE